MSSEVHEEFAHPNEKKSIVNEHPNEAGEGCGGKFGELDKTKFMPFFVHNYSEELVRKADAFDAEIIRKREEKDKVLEILGENLKTSFEKKLGALTKANMQNLLTKKE